MVEAVDPHPKRPENMVPLQPGTSRAEAFQAMAQHCLRLAEINRPAVARGKPDGLHQIRIAFRRLRTAMSLFRDVANGPGAEAIKEHLRWLRSKTGPARDLDAFINEVMLPIRTQHRKEKAVESFYQHLRRRRAQAYREAREAVLSPQFDKLVVEVGDWLQNGEWRGNASAAARAKHDAPVEIHAAEMLSEMHRKLRKKGRRLREFDEEARHRLRVQTKKLRYAAEFFASLAEGRKSRKRADAMIAALKRMQDKLGALNDIAVRKSLAAEIAGRVGPGSARKQSGRDRIYVAGLIAGHQEAHIGPLLDEAEKAFAAFRKVKPFWKDPAQEAEEKRPVAAMRAAAAKAAPRRPRRGGVHAMPSAEPERKVA